MRWDIFGRKKIDELILKIDSLNDNIVDLNKQIERVDLGQCENDANIEMLINEIKKLNKVTEIPLVKPIIRDAERAAKKEKKDKLEPDTINNLWKN